MATKVRTHVYLDRELKEKAKKVLKEYGLSLSEAMNLFLAQIVKQDLPTEEVASEATLRVIEEARQGINMRPFSLEEFKEILDETTGSS